MIVIPSWVTIKNFFRKKYAAGREYTSVANFTQSYLKGNDCLTYHIRYGYTAPCGRLKNTAGWRNRSMVCLVNS